MKGLLFLGLAALLLALLWAAPANAAGITAIIDKSKQRMLVYDDWCLRYDWPASTGLLSSYTPSGTFHPVKFAPGVHPSSKYGKNMYWAVYYKGVRAIHGIDNPDDLKKLGVEGSSMGCTHLTPEDAKTFYHMVHGRTDVTIVIQQ